MKRVLIIGCGGSGKSTLALALAKLLDSPLHHLDQLFWKPGWVPSDSAEFAERLEEVLDQDTWIIDGNYRGSLPQRVAYADTIIFLDLPTVTCLVGALRRVWQYRGHSRPDMTEGNTERIDLQFLNWILTFRRTRRPAILAMLEPLETSKNVFILQSREEIAQFLSRLETDGQPS